MKKFFTPKNIVFIGIGVLLFFLYVIFITNRQPGLTVITSTPSNNSKSVDLNQVILLNFNQKVVASDLSIQSTPEEIWDLQNKNNASITLSHKLVFHPSTDYVVNVFFKDKLIHSLSFTTQKSQGDIRLIQTIEEKMKIDYPLSKLTPYNQPGYSVVYSSPLTLEITIRNPNFTTQEIIDEVKSWVTQNGGDASAHKYVVAP